MPLELIHVAGMVQLQYCNDSIEHAQLLSKACTITTITQSPYPAHPYYRYAHCWVQVGVAMSMLRALGIPCRAVTLYEVAVLTKQLGQVNRYFTAEGDILLDLQTDQQW